MAADPAPVDAARLLALAEAVADGRHVDWLTESSAVDPETSDLVQQLRLLAGVASVHRACAVDETATAAGDTWGPLTILNRVGQGSFGAVFRARDPRLDRDVALKLLHRTGDTAASSLLIEEGRLLASVRHPNVVTVHGADRIDGTVGIWMEFVEGRTLEEILRSDGPFGAREAAGIGVDLASALAAVHARGLLHRDVKAQNVMREAGGRIILMDFGAGQETAAGGLGTTVGTPAYMAPEVLAGAPASARSDIYSLGVLLFHLVTARYPVDGRTAGELAHSHTHGRRLRLSDLRADLPGPFVEAVERALAPDPGARFASAGEFLQALSGTLAIPAGSRSRRLTQAALLIGALAVASASVGWLMNGPSAAPPAAVRSIGVRPITDASIDARDRYFAGGLTDVLLATLGGVSALRVVILDGATDDAAARDRARQAGVDAILETTLQRSGGRVRVSARLVRLSSGALLWGRAYEGNVGEAFTLQGKIASDLTKDVNLSLTRNETSRLARTYDVSSEAQDAYLHGRYLLDSMSAANLKKARELLEYAVKLEPLYAPAHAALALTYMAMGNTGSLTPREVAALAPPAATLAYNQDPMLAEAALAIADVRFRIEWNWQGADAAYKHAIALNPSSTAARGRYARFLAAAGRPQEGLAEALEAYRIDPLSTEIHGVVGIMLCYAGRYEEAIRHFTSRADSMSERTHIGLARAYAGAGRHDDAVREMTQAYARSGQDPTVYAELGRAYAAAGRTAEARQVLAELEARRRDGHGYIAPQDLAYVYIALGDVDEGLRLLESAVAEHASRLLWLSVDNRVDAVRADPRFKAILARIGLGQ